MLRDKAPKGENGDYPPLVLSNFDTALRWVEQSILDNLGIDLTSKKYYVCNQDEHYAKEVIDLILGNTEAAPLVVRVPKKYETDSIPDNNDPLYHLRRGENEMHDKFSAALREQNIPYKTEGGER